MPNHYHILIRVRDTEDSNSISQSMKRLSDSYTKAINKASNRTGSIFEGCYKAKLIETTDQLLMNILYIYTNPVKNKLVMDIEKWPFSNYLEWIGERSGTLVEREFIRQNFADTNAYISAIADYLSEKK